MKREAFLGFVRRKLALSAALCLLAGVSASQAAESSSWESVYAQGQESLAQGNLNKAEELFRTSYKLVQSQPHAQGDLEKCLNKLGDTLALNYKTDEAQTAYQNLLKMQNKRYGENSPQSVKTLISLGSVQEAAGNHSAAMTFYQRALNINEKSYGPYSPAVADNLHRLVRATYKSGDKEQADKHYKRAIGILAQQPGLEASQQLETLVHDYNDLLKGNDDSNKSLIRDFKKDILNDPGSAGVPPAPTSKPASEKSSSFSQQSQFTLSASQQWQTNEEPKVVLRGMSRPLTDEALAPAYKIVNDTIFKENRYGQGEPYYQRMIATDIDSLGPYHPSVANDLNGLAQLYISQQRYSEAQPLLKRALGIYEQSYGGKSLLTVNTTCSLAAVEYHLGNTDQSVDLYRRALADGHATKNLETAKILNNLAYLYYQQGKLQESSNIYEWALATTEGAVGRDDPLVAACLKDYAQVLTSLGREGDATAIASRAAAILAKK